MYCMTGRLVHKGWGAATIPVRKDQYIGNMTGEWKNKMQLDSINPKMIKTNNNDKRIVRVTSVKEKPFDYESRIRLIIIIKSRILIVSLLSISATNWPKESNSSTTSIWLITITISRILISSS